MIWGRSDRRNCPGEDKYSRNLRLEPKFLQSLFKKNHTAVIKKIQQGAIYFPGKK